MKTAMRMSRSRAIGTDFQCGLVRGFQPVVAIADAKRSSLIFFSGTSRAAVADIELHFIQNVRTVGVSWITSGLESPFDISCHDMPEAVVEIIDEMNERLQNRK